MKATPTAVLVCATVIFCATLTGVVILSLARADFTEFRAIINTVLNVAGAVTGLGSLLYAGSAARSAGEVREQLRPGEPPDVPGTGR